MPPQRVMTAIHRSFSVAVLLSAQNGSSRTDVVPIKKDPIRPATKPHSVTPPLVPGGTSRSDSDVISLGRLFDRMPNSDENVSAATAA